MFVYYQPNPCGRSVGDCAVRAVSKALNISWEESYKLLCEFGENMCDLPHADWVWGAVLRSHGFERVVVPSSCPDCYTAREFCEDNPEGVFVLGFGGHCCTVVDGDIYDSWDSSNEVPVYVWCK